MPNDVRVQSLTLEGRFHIHLLEVESFSELIIKTSDLKKGQTYERHL